MVQQADAYLGAPPPADAQRWKPTVELGRTGSRRFYGLSTSEEFDPDLRGQRGMRRLDEMRRNDPDVGAILWAIEMSMLSVDWTVERQSNSPKDEEAAVFLEQCWEDMSLSPRDFLSDIFTMFPFGFALGEIIYKQRNGEKVSGKLPDGNDVATSKYDDGKIGWRKVAPRHQETIERWDFDPHGGLRGAWQQLPMGGRVYLPIDKCLLFTTRRERGNPEGYSILRNAWHSYYIKTNIQEIEVISAERDMTGIPYFKLPVGASEQDKNAALSILEKLKWDDQAGVVLPRLGSDEKDWWEFGTVTSPGAPRIDTSKVIERCTVAIARSVLAQFLTLGQGRVGSYALSKDMRDLFHLVVKGWFDRIEETINRFMVERLFKLNDFQGITDIPKLRHGRMGQRAIDAFTGALEKLFTMGMPMTNDDWNFIRKELEMPEIPEDEFMKLEQEKPEGQPQANPEDVQTPPGGGAPGKTPPPEKQQQASERWFSREY